MSAQEPFTVDQFYKFLGQQKLMAGKCLKCGNPKLIYTISYGSIVKYLEPALELTLTPRVQFQQTESYNISHSNNVEIRPLISVMSLFCFVNCCRLSAYGMTTARPFSMRFN